MTKTITFKAINKWGFDVQPKPVPASAAVPKWWKDLPVYTTLEGPYSNGAWSSMNRLFVRDRSSNFGPKKCTPMLDALTSGYVINLWADVQISNENNVPLITWKTHNNVFEPHGPASEVVETPEGFYPRAFKYLNTWVPITPPGYSVLITSPFGYKNLPIRAIPGIIDSDKSQLELVAPVWIKQGFEGIIEKGTPILQITPFKREDWVSEFSYYKEDEFDRIQESTFNGTIVSHYLKNIWSKKSYK